MAEPTGREQLLAYMDQARRAGVTIRTISWSFRDQWSGGRRLCVWCGKPLPPGKQQQRWCSGGKCVAEFKVLKGDMGDIRTALRKRTKEMCEGCGTDLKALSIVLRQDLETLGRPTITTKQLLTVWGRWRNWFGLKGKLALDSETAGALLQAGTPEERSCVFRLRAQFEGFARRSLWQADHIIAVESGGVGLDMKNFQLLCTKCHLAKTNEAKTKKAQSRKKIREKSTRDCFLPLPPGRDLTPPL